MGNFSAVMGMGPECFSFRGTTASVPGGHTFRVPFKNWCSPTVEYEIKSVKAEKLRELRRATEAEERRLKINRSLRI